MHETELHRLIALAVFVGTYVGLGIGRLPPFRVDRTGVAIIGAAVMVVTGVIPWERVLQGRRAGHAGHAPRGLADLDPRARLTAISNSLDRSEPRVFNS